MSRDNGHSKNSPQNSSDSRLSARDLRVLNIAVAAAQNRSELPTEIEGALLEGVTDVQVLEILDEVARRTGTGVAAKAQALRHLQPDDP